MWKIIGLSALLLGPLGMGLTQADVLAPPERPVAYKPCWIEPWLCKAPPYRPTPTEPKPKDFGIVPNL